MAVCITRRSALLALAGGMATVATGRAETFLAAPPASKAPTAILLNNVRMFDGIEDLFPGGAKCFRRFFPGKAARPTSQEEHIGFGQRTFAVAPRNFFDDDGAATTAIDAPHGVEQKDEKSPQGDELKAPFGKLIVAGRRLMAARADRRRALARPHGDFDALVVRTEPGAMIDKSPKAMAAV